MCVYKIPKVVEIQIFLFIFSVNPSYGTLLLNLDLNDLFR